MRRFAPPSGAEGQEPSSESESESAEGPGRLFTAHLHVNVDVGAILAVILLPPTILGLAALVLSWRFP